ncbi:MAG TPA: pilin [Candidatus Andersenbacteria bacterium]|nr:pilin [Candidatus Andersenbacteria bacterium]
MASVLLFTACMPIFVYATDPTDFTTGLNDVKTLAGQSGLNDKQQTTKQILQTIVAWLMSLLGTIALISLLYGGYLYITAQGEEGNVEKAKSIILYSTIGIILIGLSAVIVNVVISVATQ